MEQTIKLPKYPLVKIPESNQVRNLLDTTFTSMVDAMCNTTIMYQSNQGATAIASGIFETGDLSSALQTNNGKKESAEKRLNLTYKRLQEKGYCQEKDVKALLTKLTKIQAHFLQGTYMLELISFMLCNIDPIVYDYENILDEQISERAWKTAIEMVAAGRCSKKVAEGTLGSYARQVEPYMEEVYVYALYNTFLMVLSNIAEDCDPLAVEKAETMRKQILKDKDKLTKQSKKTEIQQTAEIESYKRQLHEKNEKIREITRENELLRARCLEAEQKAGRKPVSETAAPTGNPEEKSHDLNEFIEFMNRRTQRKSVGSGILNPIQDEVYPGEQSEFIVNILRQIRDRLPKESRALEITDAILEQNKDCTDEGKERLKAIKKICNDASLAKPQNIKALQALGYDICQTGTHLKIKLKNNPKYSYTLSLTPSDGRSGKNFFSEISRSLAVSTKV